MQSALHTILEIVFGVAILAGLSLVTWGLTKGRGFFDNPVRVLIVDDQPRARKSLAALLSTWPRVGKVQEAGDGREAVQMVEALQPGVVLMDVRMPEMDGLQAMAQIKVLWPQVKVVVLSMYAEYRDEALALGADAFVTKADAPHDLLRVLEEIVEEIDVLP